jgi:hypothetical protein
LARVGVPHLVVVVADVDAVALMERGHALRFDPALAPDGANINFISSDGRRGTADASGECGPMNGVSRRNAGVWHRRCGCGLRDRAVGHRPATHRNPEPQRAAVTIRSTKASNGRYEDVWLAGRENSVQRCDYMSRLSTLVHRLLNITSIIRTRLLRSRPLRELR